MKDEGAIHAVPLPPGWDQAVRLEEDPATIPDPAAVEVPAELRAEIEGHIAKYPERHSAALPALGAAQRGTLVLAACHRAGGGGDAGHARLPVERGHLLRHAAHHALGLVRYVYVCTSVACHLRDAKALYDQIAAEALEQDLQDVEVRQFECSGACEMAPMASIDGRYVGPLDGDDARELVRALKEGASRFRAGRWGIRNERNPRPAREHRRA